MHWLKVYTIVVCLVLAFGAFPPPARADKYNQKLKITFNKPVEIPGVVLPAGTYWFVLENTPSRGVMQVFSEDWSRLYKTAVTQDAERERVTDRAQIEFAERPKGKPKALLTLYYPGFEYGHEFVYRPKEDKELARDAKQDVVPPLHESHGGGASGK